MWTDLVQVDLAANRSVPFEDEFKTKIHVLEERPLEA
jgi:hypothetical protein